MRNRLVLLFLLLLQVITVDAQSTGSTDRTYWTATLVKIAAPVLENLAANTLKKNMPFESLSASPDRKRVSYLEAVGRTLCGISPWLELGLDSSPEGKLRARYIGLAVQGLSNAVNPGSPDYLVFNDPIKQPLVDAAFLAQALLRAPKQLWGNLDAQTKSRLIEEFKRSRAIKPNESNWLLFASMVETALLELNGDCDTSRLNYGVNRFCKEWYKGDGWYGDGSEFHMDYYNSLVINPMLFDVLRVLKKRGLPGQEFFDAQLKRSERFAETLERFISPEGTYPVIGRSIVYRFGVFHALAQASLSDFLPKKLAPAQVRSALTAVMKKQLQSPGNFDSNGWLKVGFSGSQLTMSEEYINTGSLYLCTAVFLPLGLPAESSFWSGSNAEWTSLKAWNGKDVGADKALRGNQ